MDSLHSPSKITLYDLPSKAGNYPGTMITWRTRYALNLPYQTVYVELPAVEALAKKIGASPTSTKPDAVSPFYTIPIIQDDSTGAVVSDLAGYLDKTYPSSGARAHPNRDDGPSACSESLSD
ncbi:hypothetical protein EDD85DRAFT_957296 [Armillaria nabsnona]|nr:hypothetical protein EDD85DRAFT_957296 [Armillaria nabsnona]